MNGIHFQCTDGKSQNLQSYILLIHFTCTNTKCQTAFDKNTDCLTILEQNQQAVTDTAVTEHITAA